MSGKCPRCGSPVDDDRTVCRQCQFILPTHIDDVDELAYPEDIIPDSTVVAGDYSIVRMIGMGGAGTVYEARQISLDNMPVAIKVLHQDLNDDERIITLLKKEVIIARELTHEHIMKVYSLEKMEDRYFIVMEFVEGDSLQAVLDNSGSCTLDFVAPIIVHVCDALQYAHDRGVMHLDIKPANILVSDPNHAKLCDFGIARMAIGNITTATQRIITGSVGYMPPEQYRGRKYVSYRSDVYSLGATVYASLTGEVPIGIRVEDDVVPSCVLQAMQRKPEKRYASVKEFRDAFVKEVGFEENMGTIVPQTVSMPSPVRTGEEASAIVAPTKPSEIINAGTVGTETDVSTVPTEIYEPSDLEKAYMPTGTWWGHARISMTLLRDAGAQAVRQGILSKIANSKKYVITAAGALAVIVLFIFVTTTFIGDRILNYGSDRSVSKTPEMIVGGMEKSNSERNRRITGTSESRSPRSEAPFTRAVIETVQGFVQSLTLGDFNDVDHAYSFLSKQKQNNISREVFRDYFFKSPRLWKVANIIPSKTALGQGFAITELVVIDEYLGTYDRKEVNFNLVQENGSWKIDSYGPSSQTH